MQSLKKVRGAWASISIEPEEDATRVLNIATDKHACVAWIIIFDSLKTTYCCSLR